MLVAGAEIVAAKGKPGCILCLEQQKPVTRVKTWRFGREPRRQRSSYCGDGCREWVLRTQKWKMHETFAALFRFKQWQSVFFEVLARKLRIFKKVLSFAGRNDHVLALPMSDVTKHASKIA